MFHVDHRMQAKVYPVQSQDGQLTSWCGLRNVVKLSAPKYLPTSDVL